MASTSLATAKRVFRALKTTLEVLHDRGYYIPKEQHLSQHTIYDN